MAQVNKNNIPNENAPINPTSNPNVQKVIGNQLWELEVTFNNHTSKPYVMSPNIIKMLVIEDDLLSWPYKGYLIYENIYEGIEKNKNKDAWFYRSDGRDELTITFKLADENKSKFPEEIWEMEFDFIIYDMEDLPSSNIATKVKKIYFWDKKYQIFQDKKIEWSTATANGVSNPALATDAERSMLTGDAIKALLTDKKIGAPIEIDEENWDKGGTTILYTSPSNFSVDDDLNHLLLKHVSEKKNDICIFTRDRFTKKFQLKPLHKFFKEAGKNPNDPGDLQIEHLFFEEPYAQDEGLTTPYKAPYAQGISFKKDIKVGNWNKIDVYQFVDMAGIDSSKCIVSKPVFWYDFGDHTFGADYAENEINSVKGFVKGNYVSELLGDAPLFALNKSKKEQYNIDPEFVYSSATQAANKNGRTLRGKGKILFSNLFLNECISYRVLGSSHRIAGTFVGIDRLNSGDNTKFDSKICGQWFVVNVKHVWFHNKYVNDVTAVKIHSYEDLKINEEVD